MISLAAALLHYTCLHKARIRMPEIRDFRTLCSEKCGAIIYIYEEREWQDILAQCSTCFKDKALAFCKYDTNLALEW